MRLQDGLICYQREEENASDPIPGCSGLGVPTWDYCYYDYTVFNRIVPTLVHVGDDDEIEEFSLQECQGDCDSDADCAYGLVCFERLGNETVPGCMGEAIPMEDYCIPPQQANELTLHGINGVPEINYPLKACQGDCGTDDDCEVSIENLWIARLELVPASFLQMLLTLVFRDHYYVTNGRMTTL